MSTLENKYDALEKLIYDENWRIQALDIHQELDLMLIILNTKAILQKRLSAYSRLSKATKEQLYNYQLIEGGTGIHWDELDEDLSLKGFLQDELKKVISNNSLAA